MATRRLEDVIRGVLTGDAQGRALDFVAHLRASGIPIEESETYWDVQLDGRSVCFLWVDGQAQAPGPWTIWSDQEPGTWVRWSDGGDADEGVEPSEDARTREIAWANLNRCASCGGDCSPGKRKMVLGRPFDNLCSSALAFADPDADAVACAKRMVDARRQDILRQG